MHTDTMPRIVRTVVRRYGRSAAALAAVVALIVVYPSPDRQPVSIDAGGDQGGFVGAEPPSRAARDGTADSRSPASGLDMAHDASTGSTVASPGANGPGGLPGSEVAAAGCRPDGRQSGIGLYMPPCAAPFSGENGGSTVRGVAANRIVVARMVAETDPATRAILNTFPGAGGPDDVDRVQRVFLRYFNAHYQTYGREVVFVDVRQSGEPGDEAAMRADAQRVVEEVGAFAVMLGPGGRPSPYFVDELGARGGICVGCAGWPFWRSAYTRYPGSLWQVLGPPLDEYYAHVAEYIGKRLARQRAEWAGDPTFTSSERRFGLIWMDGDLAGPHPEAKKSRDFFLSELARYRVTIAGEASYVWDLARTQEQATSVIAKMKQAGVTSVACFCDGITAIFFTREATRQLYFPEWIITGVRQMDAVVTGRAFDQAQWRHAFGISAVPVPAATRSLEVMYRAYRHMIPDAQPDDVRGGAIADYSVLETVFTGIHMAGPHLTTQAFAAALYDYPPTGGTAIEPLMDYTPQSPASVNDFTELWWDPEARGTDETGIDGEGMYRRVDSGRRYPLGGWPSSPPRAFQIEGSVITTDDPPPGVAHEQDGHTHPEDQRCLSCQ